MKTHMLYINPLTVLDNNYLALINGIKFTNIKFKYSILSVEHNAQGHEYVQSTQEYSDVYQATSFHQIILDQPHQKTMISIPLNVHLQCLYN